MKFSQFGRITLASVVSLALALGMTACTTAHTIAYLYVTTSKADPGLINAYKIDSDSGALTPLPDQPFPSGGRNPVALVVSPNNQDVYVANRDDSSIVEFAIGTDGKLYSQNTYNTTGSFPTSVAIDPSGKYLLVAFTYQPGYTTASPGPGGINVFPINTDGSLGTPVANGSLSYFPVGNGPIGINVTKFNNWVYVADQSDAQVVGYALNTSNGTLSLLPGCTKTSPSPTTFNCYSAGTTPSAIISSPDSRFLYVTDEAANQLIGYVIGTDGSLTAMVNGPFRTGLFPMGITIDPRGKFMYVANYNDNTLSSYAINQATGNPAGVAASNNTAVATGPTCVTIEPSLGIYLYTSNFLDGTVSGKQLDPHTGSLIDVQGTKFPASGQPTCDATVAAAAHPTQIIQP
ncbi:MAG: lactonase family protein [Acidobacteriaceae bacterium]